VGPQETSALNKYEGSDGRFDSNVFFIKIRVKKSLPEETIGLEQSTQPERRQKGEK